MTGIVSRLDSVGAGEVQKKRRGAENALLGNVALTHKVRARRTTVAFIWGVSSVVLLGPVIAGEIGYVPGLLAITLAFAAMTSVSLRATVEIDSENRLTIRYLCYSFSDDLENIQVAALQKFDFYRDANLGFKKLHRGTRLPCFNVGWFVLRNGAVAFACLSRKRRARALMTRDGCYLLVDPHIARRIQAIAARSGLALASRAGRQP
ncbi:MAG: hypothetical protein F4171_16565 [Gammaproteobacteria bacterium]|nr:hypothetical protein [Gammaproteobacteria bacterium]MYE85812.1 hypothetical protein [Gammaproteobacteria bacterium]MYG14386.1 hypothetical protein [Gammaproteobacteria bacterium]